MTKQSFESVLDDIRSALVSEANRTGGSLHRRRVEAFDVLLSAVMAANAERDVARSQMHLANEQVQALRARFDRRRTKPARCFKCRATLDCNNCKAYQP